MNDDIYSYLAHHGVRGQKLGIRRYQNTNDTLTEAGKKRYQYNRGSYGERGKKRLAKDLTKAPNKNDQDIVNARVRNKGYLKAKAKLDKKLAKKGGQPTTKDIREESRRQSEAIRNLRAYQSAQKEAKTYISTAKKAGLTVTKKDVEKLSSDARRWIIASYAVGGINAGVGVTTAAYATGNYAQGTKYKVKYKKKKG